ncbi:MAG: hypothetical protein JXQ23_05985, partial [Clostridia bacterium]|nr:hypothetical protein [Clostridia bacterium]
MNAKSIAVGGLSIALICIFFTLFKGVTNILNAFLVPLALYLSLLKLKKKEIFAVYFVLAIICFLFFRLQFIFVLFYCLIAYLLSVLKYKKLSFILSSLILTFAVSISFWLSIMLTDFFLFTHMGDIMLAIFNGSYVIYFSVL